MAAALAVLAVSLQDHHGGKDHGGGSKRNPIYAVLLLVACIYPFRPAIPNTEQFETMSEKETNRNETPWRARGFKKPFSGTKYQEFIDANKSNVLKLNLRQRELQCGKYATKSVDMTAASAVDLTNVISFWPVLPLDVYGVLI